MRTADFSRAPKQGQAEAMLVVEIGAGRGADAGTPRSLAQVAAEVRRAPGHIWSKRFRRRAFSRGVVACFATPAEAEAAARVVSGAIGPGREGVVGENGVARKSAAAGAATTAGTSERVSARVLEAEAGGYSNGVWRAEGKVMAHIPTFTPTSVEAARGAAGPAVARPRATPGHLDAPPGDLNRDREDANCRKGGIFRALGVLSRAPGVLSRARGPQGGMAGAPRPVTEAGAMFIGATRYRGPSALVQLSRTWYPMVARMQTLRGYVWHTIYWEPPFTLGTLAFFATRDDLLSFARLPAHRALMQWITRGTRNGTGGYIRLHLAPGEHPTQRTRPATAEGAPPHPSSPSTSPTPTATNHPAETP